MLTQNEVAPYLLQHKLISTEAIVRGDLIVMNASRRNHNFIIVSECGPSYLLKQGVNSDTIATIAHEATVYKFLQSKPEGNSFCRYLPRCYGYDAEEHTLILEYLTDVQDFRKYYTRLGRFPTSLAKVKGNALGTLHRLIQVEGDGCEELHTFAYAFPWVLSLHRPNMRIFRDISSANIQIIKIIQQFPEFCQLLDMLRQAWRAETLIHFDIKWDNCIIPVHSTAARKHQLKIIDWEFAGMGDPCWDVGSVFNDYLSFWLFSIPITGEIPPDRFPELSRYPLSRMQPAIRSFWQSYAQRMELDASAYNEWLLRAVKYGAARMVQTAFEQMQVSVQLTGNIICLLQPVAKI